MVLSSEIEARCSREEWVVWAVEGDEVVLAFVSEKVEVFLEGQVSFVVDLSFPQSEGDVARP
jgi:hypothetical protein